MRKNRKKPKKRIIKLCIFIIIISISILFLCNKFIKIKDISPNDIHISLSTDKITGNNIKVSVSTDKKYDIYYYIELNNEENENMKNKYYEENLDNDSNINKKENSQNAQNNNSKNTLNNIPNEQYTKCKDGNIIIENNGTIYLKYGKFKKLSLNPYTIKIDNIDKQGPEIGEIETNSTDSTISVNVKAFDIGNSNLKYYFKLSEDTNFICTDSVNSYTFNNLKENETYIIYIKVIDGFGNETEAATDAIVSSKNKTPTVEKKVYYFKVNIAANTVTVYDKDENGEYTEPIKAMICSTGKSTPKSGKYKISYKYRWLALFGNVYGQYAVRIYGNILFHSVPYLNTYPDTLKYEEYDKLGTSASAGCVRLSVKDAKWIYDNALTGSYVEFYSDKNDPGPLGKPTSQKISSNKEKRNWDPTDPDTRNPWNGGNGIVYKTEKNTQKSSTQTTKEKSNTNTSNTTSNTTNFSVSNNISNNTSNNINEVNSTTLTNTANELTNTISNTNNNNNNIIESNTTNSIESNTTNTSELNTNNTSESNTTNITESNTTNSSESNTTNTTNTSNTTDTTESDTINTSESNNTDTTNDNSSESTNGSDLDSTNITDSLSIQNYQYDSESDTTIESN